MSTKRKTTPKSTSGSTTANAEKHIKDIRRNTRKIFSSEQKMLIILEGIRAEISVTELCRKHGITTTTYYSWNKEFMEAGKRQLQGDILRGATSDEVEELKAENRKLKESIADLVVRYDIVKKSLSILE